MASHRINRETFHYKWDNAHQPVISIKSGDTVTFEINEVTSWQITKTSTSETLARLDDSKLYPLAGPVYVEDAEAGDTLVVRVKKVKPGRFGWSGISPGLGLLEEFNKPFLYKWNLTSSKFARFKKGIKIPIRPMMAPDEPTDMPSGDHQRLSMNPATPVTR